MEWVGGADFSGSERRQFAENVGDIAVLSGSVRRRNEFDGTEARGDEDEPGTMLRQSVVRAIDDLLFGFGGKMETGVCERVEKVEKDVVSLKFWDVLHAHDVNVRCLDEAGEMVEQRPVVLFLQSLALSVFRERLAGRASHEDADVSGWIKGFKRRAGEVGYALIFEFRSAIVVLVSVFTIGINVITSGNIDARIKQPMSKATRTAEKINGGGSDVRRFFAIGAAFHDPARRGTLADDFGRRKIAGDEFARLPAQARSCRAIATGG